MANYEKEIYELGQANNAKAKKSFSDLTPNEVSDLSKGLKLYLLYCQQPFTLFQLDPRVSEEKDPRAQLEAFFEENLAPRRALQDIIDYLSKSPEKESSQKKEEPKKEEKDEVDESHTEDDETEAEVNKRRFEKKFEDDEKKKRELQARTEVSETTAPLPQKEISTVPAELETLVAIYKESQADKLEADTTHTVADAVKRARKTWEARNRTEIILKNRSDKQKEAEDLYFINTVDPKSESRQAIYRNVESVARQAVIAQAANLGIGLTPAQIKQATADLTYLGLSGSVDITNFNDLNTISQLAFIVQGIKFTSPINNVNEVVQAWQKAEEIEPFSDKVDELEKQIILADQEAEKVLREKAETDRLNKFERELNKNLDLDNDMTAAAIEARNVQNALLRALPNAKLPPLPPTPLQLHEKELETLLRKADPSVQINPEGLGARTISVLQTTNSSNRNISPEALKLYSLGIDVAQLDSAIAKNPELRAYFETEQGKSVYQQVHYQLGKIQNSKLGQEISANLNIKPLSGISKSITSFYNSQPPIVQSATKFILNPKGTVYAWVNKKIGQRVGNLIIKNFGSASAQKLGSFILKEGLKQGVKQFAEAAAKQLVIAAAKQAGIQGAKMAGMVAAESAIAAAAAALGIPTMGLSLIIGAILMVATVIIDATVGLVKRGLDRVWQEAGWGDKFRSRDLIIPIIAVGAAVATAGASLFAGLVIIRRSILIAIVSAIGIVVGSLIVTGLYLAMAYLIAPILSTLVQFDSLSQVDYAEYGGGGGPGGGPGPGTEPGGGVYNLDCGEDAGSEIMIQAGSYPVVKKLLTGPGRTGYCIFPTKIVIHWSGGWTNNDVTYNVLVERGLSCQIGTDQDGSVQQWQQMWEKKAELAYCVGGNENNYSLNNEMVGAYFIPPGTFSLKPEEKAPSTDEIKSSVNSTCFMMKQYHIPYTQIFGHYQLHPGKTDPGVEFLNYFINEVKKQCP